MWRAVFLDRDGVLTRLVRRGGRRVSPRTIREFAVLPGAREAVRALRRAGWPVIVVTNQPEAARGRLTQAVLERMHRRLRREVAVDAIYTCPHDDADDCDCRKPKPGLFHRAARERNINLKNSFVVGDSWKDIAAGRAAGCTTILVGPAEADLRGARPNFLLPDLSAAVELILTGVVEAGSRAPSAKPRAGVPKAKRARRPRSRRSRRGK